jgi:hypothetical protein
MAIAGVDVLYAVERKRGDMKRIICPTILTAAAALAGCEQETIVAQGPYDPRPNAAADAASIKLPPSIMASKTYRCRDNSLIYIDWYSDGSARVKANPNEAGTSIPAPAEGNVTDAAPSPLTGSANSPSITYAGKSCKA